MPLVVFLTAMSGFVRVSGAPPAARTLMVAGLSQPVDEFRDAVVQIIISKDFGGQSVTQFLWIDVVPCFLYVHSFALYVQAGVVGPSIRIWKW